MQLSLASLQNVAEENRRVKEKRLENLAKPCEFCNKFLIKYTCPKCRKGYCSVECYKSMAHRECSTAFNKEQSEGQTEAMKSSEKERETMNEILKRNQFVAPEGGGPLEFVGDPFRLLEEAELDFDADEDEESDEETEEEAEEEPEQDEETIRRRKDLEIRMEGLNIEEADFDEIWERLNSREREEFARLARQLEEEENKPGFL